MTANKHIMYVDISSRVGVQLQLFCQHLTRLALAYESAEILQPAGLNHRRTGLAGIHVGEQGRRVLRVIVADRLEMHQQGEYRDIGQGELFTAKKRAIADIAIPTGQLFDQGVNTFTELLASLFEQTFRRREIEQLAGRIPSNVCEIGQLQ